MVSAALFDVPSKKGEWEKYGSTTAIVSTWHFQLVSHNEDAIPVLVWIPPMDCAMGGDLH